jgi:YHS domain-containing protein
MGQRSGTGGQRLGRDHGEDPICGQTVDEQEALSSEFEGKMYFFCSADCKQEFDDDPERYVGWGGTARFGSA